MFRPEGAPGGAGTGEGGVEDSKDILKNRSQRTASVFTAQERADAEARVNKDEAELANAEAKFNESKAKFEKELAELDALKNKAGMSGENSGAKKVSPEKAKKTSEKAKGNSGLKRVLAGVAVIGVAAIVAITAYNSGRNSVKENPDQIAADADQEGNAEEKESISEVATYKGMFANEDGSDYNTEKGAPVNFGEALVSNATEEEMKEDLGSRMVQTGQLAATYAYMQAKSTDPRFGVEGVEFDNADDLLEKMEADADLHQKIYDYVMDAINDGDLSEDTVSGRHHNFYMDSDFESGDIDTSNVDVVKCETDEDGTEVYKLEMKWHDKDGEHIDTLTFKIRCGGQPLDKIDFTGSVREIENPEPVTGVEGTGEESVGNESAGNESAGEESVGDEGTGSEETGQEGTGEEPTGNEGTGDENTGWGKEGDPHGGDNVDVSEPVNPDSEVTQQESENVNQGNQGYVNDGGAAPGENSDTNPQVVNPDRLSGGENQGGEIMNGQNAYQNPVTIEQGQQVDAAANAAQEAAQQTITVGEDNYSDAAEVQAVESGDY